MPALPILIAPDKRLKSVARHVETVDKRIRALLDDMLDTMYAAPGIGLAATQVGIMERLVVLDLADKGEPPNPLRLVNPKVTWKSRDIRIYNEGCLSLPEFYADIERPAEVRIAYLDETGAECELHADGLLATCIQHEIDHLDGVLFIDYLSSVKRSIILRKLDKAKRMGDLPS